MKPLFGDPKGSDPLSESFTGSLSELVLSRSTSALSSLRSSRSWSMTRWYSTMCVSTVPRFACTNVLISFARSAYFSVFTVCSYCALDPLTVATITVREFPHNPSFRMRVSFESRNGTNANPFFLRFPSALMQLAKLNKLLLMFAPSRNCAPRLFVSDARSAPARSTKLSFPVANAAS